ncbi:MAG: 50S ribosomal protein L24 [Nanoarchaeota archaeon]
MVAKRFSKAWKASSNPSKQKKYSINAPLSIKHKMMSAPLSKELRKEHGVRSVPVRTGDYVKIETGQFKGKSGKVTKVSLARKFIHVEGAAVKRVDGSDSLYPIHASNVVITKLDLSDKARADKLKKLKEAKK